MELVTTDKAGRVVALDVTPEIFYQGALFCPTENERFFVVFTYRERKGVAARQIRLDGSRSDFVRLSDMLHSAINNGTA